MRLASQMQKPHTDCARNGKAYDSRNICPPNRTGSGLGNSFPPDDEAVGMVCVEENASKDILVVSENGYGKRSRLEDYRITNRGGKVKPLTSLLKQVPY